MSHDHRPFGQQMAEARRQRLKAQASVASGHPCPYHPAAPFTLPRQDMTTDKELLPCPFCGGPAELFCFPEGPKRAGCANKDATCAGFGMAPVAMWNTRPSSPAPVQGEEAAFDEIWQGLLDKDDRNSPEEYPDMVLITQDELREILSSPLQGREPTEEMLLAGEEAYWAAPKDEDGCTAMAAAYSAMLGKAKPPVQSVEWQDISTAPKDGTEILAAFGAGFDAAPPLVISFIEDFGHWILAGTDESGPVVTDQRPTHWRPLPAPPAAKGDEQ